MKMTLQNAINRGYNLLACTALALAGLAFGTVVFEEADLLDKVDDIGFLVIAVAECGSSCHSWSSWSCSST